MQHDEQEDQTLYKVVVNHEEQYSIWPAERENPLGWQDVGYSGLKAECLGHIEEIWVDMRPLSLRKQMEEAARNPQPPSEAIATEESREDDLVTRLADGPQPVELGLRPEKSIAALKACLDRGFVHIVFPHTQGGTELGIKLDRDASDLSQANFDHQTGNLRLVGGLTLNYTKVRCIADVDLATFGGQGQLEIIAG
jgi:uncharacterized protein YbdZ (MbtH family)